MLWLSWAALFALAASWVVANPLMASPDEPAHVVKAASVVRGQWIGPDAEGGSEVEVPRFYRMVTAYPTCYMFQQDATGVCEIDVSAGPDIVEPAVTPAGRYNPIYYLLVGTPSLVSNSDGALYAMRLLSAALCTFLLALGFRAAAETPRPSWAVLGAAAALTPMVVFLSATVNPAALEIAAAFALWSQLLTLLRHPDPALIGSRMAWIAVAAVLLVNSRGLSLPYCAVLVVAVVLMSRWSALVEILRSRSAWPSFAVIVAGCVSALAWVVGTNSLGSGGATTRPDLTFGVAARLTIADSNAYLTNMIGQFGWMDTNLPPWLHMAFAACAGSVVLLALATGTWRERAVLVGVVGTTFLLPVAIHSSQAVYLGIIWQGRYILPVAVGILVLAGHILVDRMADAPCRVGAQLATVVGLALAGIQLVAFIENLHRYVNGEHGGWFSVTSESWLPPLPLALVIGGAVLSSAAYAVLIAWIARRQQPASGPVLPTGRSRADGQPFELAAR
ncbi:DUF2142 domain-containing protein [Cellulomonas chengniuliangii]|uniref:DUF2142 domain-containing protein n=1 Tax=Cellulomonas chengniuliangii TaxID=2968084 RepID=A0ABY5KXW1_9CELL|nr:DUF2142 domain-containing protein [Cellulomonas chengniuliangii]UUI74514.1 DUF2142 domain-containing protein [Cellulomonas chengniuliangii]